MKKGRAGTMTHDYKRNGTTTLEVAGSNPAPATNKIRGLSASWTPCFVPDTIAQPLHI